LISYICDYRNSLSAKAQEAFNDRWGFHTLYLNSNTVLSLNRLLKDSYSKIEYLGDISALIKLHRKFLKCSKEYEKELRIFQNLSNFSRGYRLLHLFQLELIHPISASIFTAYEKRIQYPPVEIANLTRLLGVLCLLGF
jgi:DNA-dependent RNA polymerase auxiliary subunit epsilon